MLLALYVAYSGTRLFANDALAPAVDRAHALVDVERVLGLHWEHQVNRLFVDVDVLGLLGSYWYATAHYVVTAVVLVWLYRRGPTSYLPARRALLLATVLGLALYLLLPMAPPRLSPGYVDVLGLHSADGWWGSEASAPRGLGGFTNQLAAFPSLHAGWALWVALAIRSATREPRLAGVRVDPRGGHGGGGGRHREPLGPRRRGRLGGRRGRLVRRGGPRVTPESRAPFFGGAAPNQRLISAVVSPTEEPYMRIRSAVATVATLALAVGMGATSVAYADDPDVPPTAPSDEATVETSVETAEQALEDAELLFDADPRDDAGRGPRRHAGAARPRPPPQPSRPARSAPRRTGCWPGPALRRASAPSTCASTGAAAARTGSRHPDRHPRNGTPDYVDKVLKTMEKVHRTYVAGRLPRPQDGHRAGRQPEARRLPGQHRPAGPVRLLHHRPGGARPPRRTACSTTTTRGASSRRTLPWRTCA